MNPAEPRWQNGVLQAAKRHLGVVLPGANVTRLEREASPDDRRRGEYQQALLRILPAVKLVIWDLDDTFWTGTLAEGTLRYNPRRHRLVLQLSRMGIVNSICSHNDAAAAREVLTIAGVWDYFVFPAIGYGNKAEMVSQIVRQLKLRHTNVLFVDDNPRHRAEVAFWNDGIWAVHPDVIDPIDPESLPEYDAGLERLRRYQLMESQAHEAQVAGLSPEEFLRTSRITLQSITKVGDHTERLVELINRAHQLNFTKAPTSEAAFEASLLDPRLRHCAYRVTDRFGDYGICGFSSVDVERHRLVQFVFSCRLIGMGIERYVYAQLGQPQLDVVEPVSGDLRGRPDWIALVDGDVAEPIGAARDVTTRRTLMLKGGCDLGAIADFLESTQPQRWLVGREGNYLSAHGTSVLWHEHTDVLRLAADSADGTPLPRALAAIPWFDARTWQTTFVTRDYDVKVLSLLQDYGCGTYRHREEGFAIPAEYFGIDLTDPAADAVLFGAGRDRARMFAITPSFLRWFRASFSYEGPITPRRLLDNLRCLRGRMRQDTILLLLNGAEVEPREQPFPFDHRQRARHRDMNRALRSMVSELPNTHLIDVGRLVVSADDVTDRLFHYTRRTYAAIAAEVARVLRECA
jgi:FkbH-like protein